MSGYTVPLIKVPEGENRMGEKQYLKGGGEGLEFSFTVEMHKSSPSKITINSE